MKRSQMLRKITQKLKEWEGSQLDIDTARDILATIEKAGMLPPYHPTKLDRIPLSPLYIKAQEWEEE